MNRKTETISRETRTLIESLPDNLAQLLNRPDLRRASAVLLYLDRVEELRTEDPSVALSLAENGRSLASKLSFYGPRTRREVLAKSFMVNGGIARTLADHDFAEAAYICAHRLLKSQNELTSPLMVELMGRWAFLRRDQRQVETANTFAEYGLFLARRNGDHRLIGRSLVHLAITIMYDRPDEAVPVLRDALRLLDRTRDARYYLSACQCLGSVLCEIDSPQLDEQRDTDEIQDIVNTALELATNRADRFQCLWLLGKALRLARDHRAALEKISEAQQGLSSLGMVVYAASAGLDVAALHLELGEPSKARRVAREAYTLFDSMNIDREACAALALFKGALLRNELTLEIISQLQAHLSSGAIGPSRN